MPRLFIGTLADIEEQKRTEQFLASLKSTVRFTAAQNLHMTWAFIGDVPQDSVKNLTLLLAAQMNQIQEIKLPPQLLFDSIELWPDEIQPTLLVLTPSETPAAVQDCAQRILHLVRPFKTAPETFPFRAHITLARLRKGTASTNVRVSALKSLIPVPLKLTDIGLFESTSLGHQSVYRAVASYVI